MTGRREMRLNGRKRPNGFWSFTNYRFRSAKDFARIVKFPRCPPTARAIAQGRLDALVKEARRYEDQAG